MWDLLGVLSAMLQDLTLCAMIGRSATADFAALADTYGATVKVSGKVSFFELEGVTVSLRNFAKSGAEWTIQAQNSLKSTYIKIRYGAAP